ncbi:KOW motif-containing protein [Candidatus Karelsulcia muelleri]
MTIKNKDNILIKSGNYKGKKGKVIKIITNKNRALVEKRALVEILNKDYEVNRLIEIDLSNLLLIYRPINAHVLNANKLKRLKTIFINMRQMNKKLNYLFSIEELNNLLKIRYLENL